MKLTLVGVALGLVASFALTRTMKTLLFGVSATDPVTFVAIAFLLALVAFAGVLGSGSSRHESRSAGGSQVRVICSSSRLDNIR